MPVAVVEVVNMRDTLYVDNAETRFAVQITDAFGRPAPSGSTVSIAVSGLGVTDTANCTSDNAGRCTVSWTAPASVFDAGGNLTATLTVGSLPPVT